MCVRACVKGVFGLLSRAMILFSCAVPRDRRGSPWLSGYVYKGVKAGVAYPSAVSNLCIRQDLEDVCRECKVYSAWPHSPGGPREPARHCCRHVLCAWVPWAHQGAQLVAMKGHVLWLPVLPRLGFLEQGQAGSVSTKGAFMHQEPDTSQSFATGRFLT